MIESISDDVYKIVSDVAEVRKFFDYLLRRTSPKAGEDFMLCLAARNKTLDDNECKHYAIGRSEMLRTEIVHGRRGKSINTDSFIKKLALMQCSKTGLLTNSDCAFPDKCLVTYVYVNPCSELNCIDDTVEFASNLKKELLQSAMRQNSDSMQACLEKLHTVATHFRTCHPNNNSRRCFIDFDIDLYYKKQEKSNIFSV